jgi:hypothetical protein
MCDTIVIVSEAEVLLGKNSDRDPSEARAIQWHPLQVHAMGTKLACTGVLCGTRACSCLCLRRTATQWKPSGSNTRPSRRPHSTRGPLTRPPGQSCPRPRRGR